MFTALKRHKYPLILWFFIVLYVLYFSYFTVLRYQTLYASYFDLGIMHQTVFNTYKAFQTGDFSRFLEFTDPLGTEQIKRMAFHNDILLALIAPFYFINNSPATLLVVQTVVLALGALAVFLITSVVFNKSKYKEYFAIIFSFAYLMNPILQRTNIYDFHAVVLATTTLLFMFYFWLNKRYRLSLLFLVLSLMAKENVALTTGFFGLYTLLTQNKNVILRRSKATTPESRSWTSQDDKRVRMTFSVIVIATSAMWFVASVFFIIPFFRGGDHFALERYSDFGDSPGSILTGLLTNPFILFRRIFHTSTYYYFINLLGPLGFLSVFALPILLIATPELAINLLSSSWNMRNIIYQYTAVITPFIFISAIYGTRKISNFKFQISNWIPVYVIATTLLFAYLKGPLPFSLEKNIHPFSYPQKETNDVRLWSERLKDENISITSTGQLSPFFTNRRYFYNFSKDYKLADYVVLRLNEIYNYPEKGELIPAYEKLLLDPNYIPIYQKENFEVYKRTKLKDL